MNHSIKLIFLEKGMNEAHIANISFHHGIILIGETLQVMDIPGIGQFIQIDNMISFMVFQNVADIIGTDKAATAGD
jgi:hypothetical protein